MGLGLGIGLPVLEESVVARLGLGVVEQREHLAPRVERRLHDPPLARVQKRAWVGVGVGLGTGARQVSDRVRARARARDRNRVRVSSTPSPTLALSQTLPLHAPDMVTWQP